MPRFSVAFGRRKSTADNLENASPTAEPSFRVLERSEAAPGKSFDGGVRLATKTHTLPKTSGSDITSDDNIFADLKSNRGSGSSNTTKTVSTDNSSRYSNSSTTPSSADIGGQEEWRNTQRRHADIPIPPIPKSSSTGFLKAAGRTFSFGGQKKHLPPMPSTEEDDPVSATTPEPFPTPSYGRSRATTSSTSTTVTPPRVDGDFDLGGDFGKILLGATDKRASVATVRDDHNGRQGLAPRALTGSRMNQPSPIQIDKGTRIDAPPHSWGSNHSNDGLLGSTSPSFSPPTNENAPPPVPLHASLEAKPLRPGATPVIESRKPSLGPRHSSNELGEADDEEARLLKDSLSTVSKFMTGKPPGSASTSRYRRNEDTANDDDDSLFDTSHSYSMRSAGRFTPQRSNAQQSNKVMTPAEFEMYRKDKERQERRQDTFSHNKAKADDDDDDNYEEDEDDMERAKQQVKQRRKQEAHMAVYRQQMMKVTGESANASSRPSLQISFSAPNLPNLNSKPSPEPNTSENSDEDEEVPLAILAAHGFPNKARPPNRLSTMMSNPNLRAAQQPSYQRPASAVGEPSAAGSSRLPAFARNLPQDPFLGAGLIRNTVRESFALGGGSATPSQPGAAVPPGGLIGVIANEERSRALRRGSPHVDNQNVSLGGMPFDPIGGIPSHMMYPNNPPALALSPGDQAQIQMTQQMQQFMQIQMQFMQMMTAQNGSAGGMSGMTGPPSMLGVPGGPELMRHSFVGHDSMLDLPNARGDAHMRTMSMVQPSSASWVQLPQNPGFAPSIRIQGGGYTPSIAPSERSNIGLPGRYRPVSHVPPANPAGFGHLRKSSTMSGAIQPSIAVTKSGSASDDDDEEGWEAMKAKRDKKKSSWRTKKSTGGGLGAFIN